VVLDNSGAHTSGHVRWPDGIAPVPLPAYSPELNPGERWFTERREPRSNRPYESLATLEASLTQALRPYREHPSALVQLTAYPWWRQGVEYITPSSQ
jgi:transposase